jgi:hypothetical protein
MPIFSRPPSRTAAHLLYTSAPPRRDCGPWQYVTAYIRASKTDCTNSLAGRGWAIRASIISRRTSSWLKQQDQRPAMQRAPPERHIRLLAPLAFVSPRNRARQHLPAASRGSEAIPPSSVNLVSRLTFWIHPFGSVSSCSSADHCERGRCVPAMFGVGRTVAGPGAARKAYERDKRATETRLRGWACEIRTQKCRRKLCL